MTNNSDSERPEDLLTPLAYALSLSPPRAPPQDSAHRALLVGQDPRKAHYLHLTQQQQRRRIKADKHSWLWHRLHDSHKNRTHHHHKTTTTTHPHLEHTVDRDAATRRLSNWISLETFNHLRDAGWFRTICDTGVTVGVPALAVASPRVALRFVSLTWGRTTMNRVVYGSHKMQFIDIFESSSNDNDTSTNHQELIVFVHGGAWGSGMPWMYRLVAHPFLQQGKHVAIVGYRTYPDANVAGQVQDLDRALAKLQSVYNKATEMTLMGHSSGAHIALVHMVQQAKKQLDNNVAASSPYHSFVGISGCYDIHHHYDYEAARGVEELSPMKAANGYTVPAFRAHTPAYQLQDLLLLLQNENDVSLYMPRHMVVLHGMEDTTVPFTSTSECARRLKACGLANVEEIYLAKTGHQEAIMEVMTGGLTRDKIVGWMSEREHHAQPTTTSPHLVIPSRL